MRQSQKQDITFIIIICAFILLFVGIFVRGQLDLSLLENRILSKIPTFEFKSFIKNDFQKQLEDSIADQIILGENIKVLFNNFINKTSMNIYKIINSDNKGYTPLSGDYSLFEDGEYVLGRLKSLDEIRLKLEEVAGIYDKNYRENIDTYVYFVESEESFDFINKKSLFFDWIKENYHYSQISRLSLNSYEDYKKYFYKTDHHWNCLGSYTGYTDVIKMMLGENEKVLEPIEKIDFSDIYFYGSKAKKLTTTDYKENFSVYKYNIPEHKEYINGELKEYGNKSIYYNNEYSRENWVNHYGDFYGMDYSEIEYDFNSSDKENLLILSNSFSNSINDLIASHFNKTYVVDIREYEKTFNKNFNIDDYINDKKISKVLILGNLSLFYKSTFE